MMKSVLRFLVSCRRTSERDLLPSLPFVFARFAFLFLLFFFLFGFAPSIDAFEASGAISFFFFFGVIFHDYNVYNIKV